VLSIDGDESDPDSVVCRLVGDFSASDAKELRDALGLRESVSRLVLDMSGVLFVDSGGLGGVLGVIRWARERGGDVTLVCEKPGLVRVMRSAGFGRLVRIVPPSGDDGLAGVRESRRPAGPVGSGDAALELPDDHSEL
jgi:anti-sigma B factor antagonist